MSDVGLKVLEVKKLIPNGLSVGMVRDDKRRVGRMSLTFFARHRRSLWGMILLPLIFCSSLHGNKNAKMVVKCSIEVLEDEKYAHRKSSTTYKI